MVRHRRPPHAEPLPAGELEIGADVRRQRPHDPREVRRRAARVQSPLAGLDLLRVRRRGIVLLDRRDLSGRPALEHVDGQLAAEPRQPLG